MLNRRTFCTVLLAMLGSGCAAARQPSARSGGPSARRRVTLLYTNDFHGRYQPLRVEPGNATAQTGDPGRSWVEFDRAGEVGGFARQAALVDAIRRDRGDDRVLLVHGGDCFSDDLLANLTRGEAIIDLMNRVGYQFMALGNHDFDYGRDRTAELQQRARFALRGANVVDERSGSPFLGRPWQVVERGGLRVGLLALGYANTPLTGNRRNVEGLAFSSGIEAARRYVPELRENADVVVVVSHQGTAMDEQLARQVDGIDLVLAAHSHDWLEPPKDVDGVPIVQALSDGAVVAEVELVVTTDGATTVERVIYHPLWADQVEPDPAVERMIEAMRTPHRATLEQVVGRTSDRIGRQYASAGAFDVLVGQLLMERHDADVALLPGVGYGVSLPRGEVTREQLAMLIPHDTAVVTTELTGEQLLAVLQQSAFNQRPPEKHLKVGGIVQTAGMGWTIDLARPVGQRVRGVTVGGAPLDPAKTYRVATQQGMTRGLHRYDVIGQGQHPKETGEALRDAVEAMMADRTLSPPDTSGCVVIPADS